MSRYERRQFFERLCELRALYALRGSQDATSVVSIEQAIEDASRLLSGAPQIPLLTGSETAEASGNSDGQRS